MHTLAVDSSQSACTVALFKDGELLDQLTESTPGKQAEQLVMLCNKLLNAHHMDYGDLDLLAGTVGPGSFTGIRIGLAALTGINIPLQRPTYGVTTLQAMAYAANQNLNDKKRLRVCIDARRDEWFVQDFAPSPTLPQAISEPQLLSLNELKALDGDGIVYVSNAPETLAGLLRSENVHSTPIFPEAGHAGAYAYRAFTLKPESIPLLPVYIRKPDAKIPEHAQKL